MSKRIFRCIGFAILLAAIVLIIVYRPDRVAKAAAWRVAHGFPKDGFFPAGTMGQHIFIVPSERVVVARFGYSRDDPSGMQDEDDLALIDAVIRVTHRSR